MKYRVYDKVSKEYVTDDFIWELRPDGRLLKYDSANREIGIPRYIVEFSTGEKDKNGVEIYEGDIVLMRGYHGKHRSIVYFRKGKFAVDGSNYCFKDLAPQTYEVIGNIHDENFPEDKK